MSVALREKLRGKIAQRYWPGKAPDWGVDTEEEEADLRTCSSNRNQQPFHSAEDHRLRRLAETRAMDRDEIRADHRRIRQAEILSTAEDDAAMEEEDDDDDAVEEKRRMIRERLLKLLRQEERELLTVDDEDAVSTVEDSEYETDSEEEEEAIRRVMSKPVYVLPQERETIAERERLEAELRELEESEVRKIAERKLETKLIVVEMIREDYEIDKNLVEKEADVMDVDTDDDEANEYERWKGREIARIKRDREAMIKEIERVRNMTEEEKREWERKNPNKSGRGFAPKKKWTFMHKYYHKGPFFQDNPAGTMGSYETHLQDFSAPTGDDKLNKTILPKVMQVNHFGRRGRTKWTHLVNEDTTDWTTPWSNNGPLRSKYNAKMAGMNRPIAKPTGSRKL